MREPTVHALGSVLESKKATTQTMGSFETIRLRPSQRDFFLRRNTRATKIMLWEACVKTEEEE